MTTPCGFLELHANQVITLFGCLTPGVSEHGTIFASVAKHTATVAVVTSNSVKGVKQNGKRSEVH